MTDDQWRANRVADITLEMVRLRKAIARVRALIDGPIVWADDLRDALDGPLLHAKTGEDGEETGANG